MTSSQITSSTHGPFPREEIGDHDFVYSCQRLKTKLFEAVLDAFVERCRRDNFSKADLAAVMRRDPAQITRWLKGPGNWELRTVSDLMRALRADVHIHCVLFEDIRSNDEHELARDEIEFQLDVVASGHIDITDVKTYSVAVSSSGVIGSAFVTQTHTATKSSSRPLLERSANSGS